MNRGGTGLAGSAALILVLLAAAVSVQAARERLFPPAPDAEPALYLTSGSVARRLAVAYPTLAADLYWIRAIQYYGTTKLRLEGPSQLPAPPPALAADPAVAFPLLFPLLDLTTSLDPAFNVAYRFGAVFLAEPYPRGPGRPDLAVALLEKGLRARPDKWEYMRDIGFVYYWYSHDYRAAAGWFDRASEVPGAPWWLRSLAATTLVQGGDRRSSRQMWLAIRQSADNDWLKNDADRRLLQLRALDEIDGLTQAVDAYARHVGQRPPSWRALVAMGVLPGMMADPTGTPYELTGDGRVQLSSASPLWPLPEEPQATQPRPRS
jgi:hypothetical protein